MNLGDPELELVDPTPNVHSLFIHFDQMFFWTKLASRAVVRWSKRMYSCAGVCSYEGRAGLCDIALSEPLLKLRPRKDLVETLLHEMIHAFLFVTNRDQDRDGHGPNFQAHMHRINKSAGLNISIYHSFHDEVELYQTHWWRCNGPCQQRRPHFGIVRRSMNKAPGPSDYWWNAHLKKCGGTFIKIKEPEKQQKVKGKKVATTKTNADITKYITNNIKTINNVPNSNIAKPVLKDSNIMASTKTKTNSPSNVVKGVITKSPSKPIPVFNGSGNTLNTGSKHYTESVTETVRNIWANKQIIPTKETVKKVDPSLKIPIKSKETGAFKEPLKGVSNPKKHKIESTGLQSPPTKIKKIEDYFNATSILKDLYGDDYKLTQSNTSKKLVAVNVKVDLVDCPVCSGKFKTEEINRHLDECLNKDIIEKLSKDGVGNVPGTEPTQPQPDTLTAHKPKLKGILGAIPQIPAFKPKPESTYNNLIDLTNKNIDTNNTNTEKPDKTKPKVLYNVVPEISIPAFKPIPSLPESACLIDLTFDNSNIKTDKNKRKTESHTTFPPEPFIEEVILLVNQMDESIKTFQKNSQRRNTVDSILTSDYLSTVGKDKRDKVEVKAGSSKEEICGQVCPCCRKKFDKPMQEHLDECLMFFHDKSTIPDEGASTSFSEHDVSILVDDEDDKFDESQVFNATGTKTPCPSCMKMVEQDDMNGHLDLCLSL